MLKRAVSGIILTLLLTGMLTLAFNIQPVKASGTIYIRADGSVDPPDAPITTLDNVTYTLTENINITSSDDGIILERDNIIIDGNGYTVQGSVTFFSRGIILTGRSNVTIKNTRITTFHYGITTLGYEPEIDSCSYGNISGNNVANNVDGIYLSSSSGYSISGNNITANNMWGIRLAFSSGNSISGNNMTANGWAGIYLESCSGNSISGNNIANNGHGVQLYGSSSNTMAGNNITNNGYGIMLDWASPGNKLYHNNFNNTNQVCSSDSMNVWDDDYPSGGNYWSDYVGVDLYHGLYQNETGSDGIGDIPCIIDENNQDNYPLMEPWSPVEVVNATIDIDPGTLNLRSRGKWITCYVELPKGYNVSDINVTSVMLNDTVPVYPKAHAIGDYDEDGIPDLMVKFDRAEVIDYIMANVNMTELFEEKLMTVTLTITGKLNDGTPLQGNTKIRIIARAGLPRINSKISFNLSPNPALTGQTITLTGNLKNQLGNAIGNAPIEVYYSIDNGLNWIYAGAIRTNSTGWFSAKGKLTIVGIFPIAVVYRGNFRYSQSYQIEKLTVKLP
ncbi:MAG: NosD domain-containing protein [Candidatus Bathyarchaeia archaeon]